MQCAELFERGKGTHTGGMEIESSTYPVYFQHLERDQLIDASDVKRDSRTSEFWETYCAPLNVSSKLDVPIRVEGQVLGVVCHEHVGPNRQWSLDEIQFRKFCGEFRVSLA